MRLPFTSAEPLGENLIVNGDFSEGDTGWDLTNVSGGGASINTTDDTLHIIGIGYVKYDTSFLKNDKSYVAKINIESVTSGSIRIVASADASTYSPYYTTPGIYFHYFTPTSTNGKLEIYTSSSSTNVVINSVSVEEHAQETTDTSNNDNDAILKTGKCLVFDGINDGIDISNFSMSGSEGTFAFWCKPEVSSGTDYIIDLAEAGDGRFIIVVDSHKFRVFTQTGGSGGAYTHAPHNSISFNAWQRVVVTIDSSRNLNIYKDGIQLGSTQTANAALNINNVAAAYIGRNHSSVAAVFKGGLSDFQIYNKVWSSDDVAYDYANPQNLVTDNLSSDVHLRNLKAWWHLSEGSGAVIHDSAPLLGAEEVVNGDFSTDSDWTVIDGGWTISNNEACHTGSASFIEQNTNLVNGVTYKVVWSISSHTNQSAGISSNSGTRYGDFSKSAEGTYVAYLVSNGNNFRLFSTGDNCISNVSIKEVYNVHGESYHDHDNNASTPVVLGGDWEYAQERIPQLGMMNWSKGSNLLEYSEDFSEWSNVNSGTGSQVVLTENQLAPDGTLSATKMFFDKGTGSATTDYSILQTSFSSQSNTASVYLRSDTAQKVMIRNSSTFQLIDVSTDWVRINKTDSGGSIQIGLRSGYVSGEPNTSTIYVWGAQVESGASATAYRKANGLAVTDATLISCATDSQKDILGNAVRVKGSAFNLDGTGYGEVLDDNDFDIPACNSVDEGGFTLEAWVKAKYINKSSSINVVATLGGDITQPATGGICVFSDKIGAYINAAQLQADNTFIEGNWYHVVITRGDNGICRLYINANVQSDTDYTLGSITNSNNKMVGRDSLPYQRFYEERIDDVKFYNRELSSDEIQKNHNATKSAHTN